MKNRVKQIHEASMIILENVGIRLHHPEILDLLRDRGVRVRDGAAYFTRHQINACLESAPSSFTVYARNPSHNMEIGAGRPQYVAGYGCPAVIEADGTRRNAVMDDYRRFVKLVHQTPDFRLNGGILVQPEDIPTETAHLIMTHAAMTLSDKCIMGIPGTAREVGQLMEMASIPFGGPEKFREKPRVITLVNTLSPLQMDRNSLDTILVHARCGQALVICAGVMTGTTSPVTLAGSIAQGNAETLAGIAIAQMINPGTPVVMAINTTPVDMRTGGVNVGSPAQSLAVKYTAGLARMYNLPCRCGGSSSDAVGVTAQSGWESMMAMFVSCSEKVDLIMHSAGILAGYAAMSYEKFITDLEVIRLAASYFADLETDENAMALDAVAEVGWQNQYLMHPHTMKNCREAAWVSDITPSGRDAAPAVSPNQALMDAIDKKLNRMIDDFTPAAPDPAVLTQLNDYLLTHTP
ncbi:MAG: trimethylamine methyltransferase family protein [Desulfobacterales bacterium]|nr:trimethylamine methyltransferase family protein [Desulfobacterales bacterium]